MFAIYSDPQTMRWFGNDPLREQAHAETLITRWAAMRQLADPATRWGIQTEDNPALLGSCGLFAWNRAWRKCALGYELAPAAQGQGYMLEALNTVIGWGFAQMDLNRIEAQIHPDNLASIRLVQKLGFVQEGVLRQVAFWGGSHHDLMQFSLLRNEWHDQSTPHSS